MGNARARARYRTKKRGLESQLGKRSEERRVAGANKGIGKGGEERLTPCYSSSCPHRARASTSQPSKGVEVPSALLH